MNSNPCLKCGACCACYRVSFYWGEIASERQNGVPDAVTQKLDHYRAVMRGTNQAQPYCIALQGTIGSAVKCSIYNERPTPCREFDSGTVHCLAARKQHGLVDGDEFLATVCA